MEAAQKKLHRYQVLGWTLEQNENNREVIRRGFEATLVVGRRPCTNETSPSGI
jgi:hypothetical protein